MALFAAANTFRILVLFVPHILGNVSNSLLNNQRGASHEGRFRRVFWTNLAVTSGLVLVGGATVAVAGLPLLTAFGAEFRAGLPVLLILMASTLPETISVAMLQVLQSRERTWLSTAASVLPCYGTLVTSAWLLTPAYGARGLAWGYLAAMVVSVVGSFLALRQLGLWESDSAAAPSSEP
jgi:O-antigen/teichoic acid export membrane protein